MNRSAAGVSYYPFQMIQRMVFQDRESCTTLVEVIFFRHRWSRRGNPMSSVSWEQNRIKRQKRFSLSTI